MGFFEGLFGFVRTVAQVAVSVVVETAGAFVKSIESKFSAIESQYRDIDVSEKKRARFRQLEDVNDKIHELHTKKARDKHLSRHDLEKLEELLAQRRELRTRVDSAREYQQAQDIAHHSSDYESQIVDPASPNALTRLAGQSMLGKPCSRCGRPMALRWATKIVNPTVDDLFWGCTGFFVKNEIGQPVCKKSETLSHHDRQVFAVVRPGMELPQERLNRIVEAPGSKRTIQKKLSHHIAEGGENYLCPVHHLPMELREKRNADSLLDTYYLRCPKCEQMVKIKSAIQLDEIMSQLGGEGLFGTVH